MVLQKSHHRRPGQHFQPTSATKSALRRSRGSCSRRTLSMAKQNSHETMASAADDPMPAALPQAMQVLGHLAAERLSHGISNSDLSHAPVALGEKEEFVGTLSAHEHQRLLTRERSTRAPVVRVLHCSVTSPKRFAVLSVVALHCMYRGSVQKLRLTKSLKWDRDFLTNLPELRRAQS
jgi:hypothetical protein